MEETKLGKYRVLYTNSKEFHTIKREIWGEGTYYFDTDNSSPLIIDIGAHIGLSVLYFKSIYPNSKILAFEPNPNTFDILKENIYINNLENIEIHNIAIWKDCGTKDFYIDSNDTGWDSNASLIKGGWTGKEDTKRITIKTEMLSKFISRKVDLLKIDAEGSEIPILKSNKGLLKDIENIVIEYHPIKGYKVQDLLQLLSKQFSLKITSDGKLLKKPIEGKLLTIKGKNLVK